MKLYKVRNAPAGERWHSSKTGLKDYEELELPRDGRAGMATFLNAGEAQIALAQTAPLIKLDPLQEAEIAAVMAEQPQATTMSFVPYFNASNIVEFIFNQATVADVEQIFSALGTRFKELSNGSR